MQAGRGRPGFDVTRGVVFNDAGYGNGYSPPSRRRGGRDLKKNAAKHPLKGADGVVVSSYRLSSPNGFDNRWLETTTPSALNKERGRFLYGAATPPSRRRGIRVPQPFFSIWTVLPLPTRGIRAAQTIPLIWTAVPVQEGKFAGRHIFLGITRTGAKERTGARSVQAR